MGGIMDIEKACNKWLDKNTKQGECIYDPLTARAAFREAMKIIEKRKCDNCVHWQQPDSVRENINHCYRLTKFVERDFQCKWWRGDL